VNDFIIDGAPLFRLIRAAIMSYASIPHAAVDPWLRAPQNWPLAAYSG
jgi:hypothetical protein